METVKEIVNLIQNWVCLIKIKSKDKEFHNFIAKEIIKIVYNFFEIKCKNNF
jgi:hypothetical protein